MNNQSTWDEYKVLLKKQKHYESLALLESVSRHASRITEHYPNTSKCCKNLAYWGRKDVEAFEDKYIAKLPVSYKYKCVFCHKKMEKIMVMGLTIDHVPLAFCSKKCSENYNWKLMAGVFTGAFNTKNIPALS